MALNEFTDRSITPDPGAAAVRAELGRVLASPYLKQAERSSAFLRFVVEETLAGRAARLKGYTIALEVFGRPDDFDAGADPLVRVEAGRLRRRLREYYRNEGAEDPVRIDVPVGGYAARFSRLEVHSIEAADVETSVAAQPQRPRRLLLAGLATALTAAGAAIGLLAWLPQTVQSSSTQRDASVLRPQFAPTPGPTIAVTGFSNLSNDHTLDVFTAGLTEEVLVQLSAFRVSVVPASTQSENPASTVALYGGGPALTGGYVLTGGVRPAGDALRISARLVDGSSGAQVWTVTVDAPADGGPDGLLAREEQIAKQIASTIASPFGPLFEHEIERIGALPLEALDTYGCIVLFRAYAKTLDPETHGKSLECFLHVVDAEPQTAQTWAGLALLYQHEYWYGYGPKPDSDHALERAREAAQTALDVDGDNLLANLAMAGLRYTDDDFPGFKLAAQKALSLQTNAGTFAQIGLLMILAGKQNHGIRLIDIAYSGEPGASGVPTWYHIGYCFDAMLNGDYESALDWARQIDTPSWFATWAAEAAAAGLAGQSDVAARSVNRLLAMKPDFAETGYATLRGWIRNERLVSLLVEGLKQAGLDIEVDAEIGNRLEGAPRQPSR